MSSKKGSQSHELVITALRKIQEKTTTEAYDEGGMVKPHTVRQRKLPINASDPI